MTQSKPMGTPARLPVIRHRAKPKQSEFIPPFKRWQQWEITLTGLELEKLHRELNKLVCLSMVIANAIHKVHGETDEQVCIIELGNRLFEVTDELDQRLKREEAACKAVQHG